MQWFYDLKTIHKMVVLTAITVISLLIVSYTGYYFTEKSNKALEITYNNELKPIAWINSYKAALNANRIAELRIILEKDNKVINAILDELKQRSKNNNQYLDDFQAAMEQNKNDKALDYLNTLRDNRSKYQKARAEIVRLSIEGKKDEAFAYFNKSAPLAQEIYNNVDECGQLIFSQAEENYKLNLQEKEKAKMIMILVSIIGTVLCAWLSMLTGFRIYGVLTNLGNKMKAMADGNLTISGIGRVDKSCIGDMCVVFDTMLHNLYELVNAVNSSAIEVSAGAEEVSAAAEQTSLGAQQVAGSISQMAVGTQDQARDINQSVINLTDMNDDVQRVYHNAENVVKLAQSANTNATSGGEQADKAIKKINDIKQTSGETAKTINELGELSTNIGQIVDLIKSIAGQTNLLALNAAIEAARAGEHGRGFAVVAEEVKKLSEQAGTASDQITAMIKEVQGKTTVAVHAMQDGTKEIEEGVVIIATVGNALKEIVNASAQVTVQAADVSKVADNLVRTSEGIVKMMENVSAITEESAASAQEISSVTEEQTASLEEINATSQTVAKIAENLQRQIAAFKL